MRASEVRGRVFAEHAAVGEVVKRLGRDAWATLDGDITAAGRLCGSLFDLEPMLGRHFDVEEALVRDLAGMTRMDLLQMKINHSWQREYLASLCEFARDPFGLPGLLAAEVVGFVRVLVEDTEREERALVHPRFLQRSEPAPS